MENIINQIKSNYEQFMVDATAQVEKKNKAAGVRARKASLKIEKALKEFRKLSIEIGK
jgi:hypothetical protein